jgi:predicted AlkP superfamily phosphohydrolase/phosphomutase
MLKVIGIDGGTLDLIKRWRKSLPAFNEILNNGAYGVMQSTIPPITCPAWPAMFTGKNPGKLGMFDFVNGERAHTLEDYHEKTLWYDLSKKGATVGLLNIPITYPPLPVNGYMVSGLGTPEALNVDYTYPASMKLENYKITPAVLLNSANQEDKIIKAVMPVLKRRIEVAEYLMDNYPTDLFICVFFATDIVQHYFWRFIDKKHPNHEDKYQDVILNVYKMIDKFVGKQLQTGTTFIVSDHGFGSCYGEFGVNEWLRYNGYLNYKTTDKLIYKLRDALVSGMSPKVLQSVMKAMPENIKNRLNTSGESISNYKNLMDNLDGSIAYSVGSATGGIYIKEDKDIIISLLQGLGFNCIKKEDVYSGPYLNIAPDVFIEMGSSVYYPKAYAPNVWTSTVISGSHKKEGLFMAYGDGVKQKEIDINIYDILPTIYSKLNIEAPQDIDGKVIDAIHR